MLRGGWKGSPLRGLSPRTMPDRGLHKTFWKLSFLPLQLRLLPGGLSLDPSVWVSPQSLLSPWAGDEQLDLAFPTLPYREHLDSSGTLKSRDLIAKPFTISHHTQAKGGTWPGVSEQWSVALPAAGHLHRGAATLVPPISQCWGAAWREPTRVRGPRGASRALPCCWGPWWPCPHPCKGSSASAAIPRCASRICPCSSGFCTDPQPLQVKEFKSCPSNQL